MRNSKLVFNLFLFALAFTFIACGGETPEEKAQKNIEEAAEDFGQAAEKFGEGIAGLAEQFGEDMGSNAEDLGATIEDAISNLGKEGGKREPVNFRDIKKTMPDRAAGLSLYEDMEGETAGAFGFKVSTVSADYRDDDKRIEMEVVDIGTASAFLAMAPWAKIEIDKETNSGYERSSTYKGFKVFEKYDKKRERGEFNAIIDNHFIVNIKGRNVDMDDMKDAFDDINVRKLRRMGEEAREEAKNN